MLERASPGESAHAAFYIIIGNGGGQRKETAQEYLEAFENFAAKSNLFLSVTENFKVSDCFGSWELRMHNIFTRESSSSKVACKCLKFTPIFEQGRRK